MLILSILYVYMQNTPELAPLKKIFSYILLPLGDEPVFVEEEMGKGDDGSDVILRKLGLEDKDRVVYIPKADDETNYGLWSAFYSSAADEEKTRLPFNRNAGAILFHLGFHLRRSFLSRGQVLLCRSTLGKEGIQEVPITLTDFQFVLSLYRRHLLAKWKRVILPMPRPWTSRPIVITGPAHGLTPEKMEKIRDVFNAAIKRGDEKHVYEDVLKALK